MSDLISERIEGTGWGSMLPTEALLRGFDFSAGEDDVDTELLPAQTQQLAAFVSLPIEGLQQRQGFRIGELGLMVDYAQGSELTELPVVHRLPHAPEWFAGLCNLHGALVPVFDLAPRLGLEHDAKAKPMLLVLGHGPDAAGLMVDGLPSRLRVSAESLVDSATMPDSLAGLLTRSALIDERLWFDLDVPALLAQLERALGPNQ